MPTIKNIPELAGFSEASELMKDNASDKIRTILSQLPILNLNHPTLSKKYLDYTHDAYIVPEQQHTLHEGLEETAQVVLKKVDISGYKKFEYEELFIAYVVSDQLTIKSVRLYSDNSRGVHTTCFLRISENSWISWGGRIDKGWSPLI